MSIPPHQKLPVLIAKICIAWVNPQGRKKVNAPIRGIVILLLEVKRKSDRFLGREKFNMLKC